MALPALVLAVLGPEKRRDCRLTTLIGNKSERGERKFCKFL